jgi:hypothetical protein
LVAVQNLIASLIKRRDTWKSRSNWKRKLLGRLQWKISFLIIHTRSRFQGPILK